MRILHIAESIRGGCGTYLDQLIPAQLGDPSIGTVRVIVPSHHADQLPSVPPNIVRTFRASGRSIPGLRALAKTTLDEVRIYRPDIIHLHSTFAGLIGRPLLSATRAQAKIVYCAHGWAFDMERRPWKLSVIRIIERMLAPLADRIIAISDYERGRGLDIGIQADRIVTILNGIADVPPSGPPSPADRLRLLFIGRLDAQKGWDTLIDAVEDLGNKVTLRIVGASVVGDATVQRAVPAHAVLLGWKTATEIRKELAACDLVVIPSRWEGFGLVAAEAMRAGRAVLATNVGGLPEIVEDGITGRLIPPNDAKALCAAILEFDRASIYAMGEAGRLRYLNKFTIGRTAADLAEVYRDLQNNV